MIDIMKIKVEKKTEEILIRSKLREIFFKKKIRKIFSASGRKRSHPPKTCRGRIARVEGEGAAIQE
jgi:hypothetical protein